VIKLIRVKKSDWNYDLYLASNALGAMYAANPNIVGWEHFKHPDSGSTSILYPFQYVKNKGSFRSGGRLFDIDGTFYGAKTNERTVLIFTRMWIDDSPNPVEKRILHIPLTYTAVEDDFSCASDFNTIYSVDTFQDLSEGSDSCAKRIYLQKYSGEDNVFCLEQFLKVTYSILPGPDLHQYHTVNDDDSVNFAVHVTPNSSRGTDTWEATQVRTQFSYYSDFHDLLHDYTKPIICNDGGDVDFHIIYSIDNYPASGDVQYVRARIENNDQSKVSPWTSFVTLDPSNPGDNTSKSGILSGVRTEIHPLGLSFHKNALYFFYEKYEEDFDNNESTWTSYLRKYDSDGNLQDEFSFYETNTDYGSGTEYSKPPDIFWDSNVVYILGNPTEYSLEPLHIHRVNVATQDSVAKQIDCSSKVSEGTISSYYVLGSGNVYIGVSNYYNYTKGLIWNFDTEEFSDPGLPIGIWGQISPTFSRGNFWFEFDDGDYVGVAFTGVPPFSATFYPFGQIALQRTVISNES